MSGFWILAVMVAAAAQTARNAMQSSLTALIGTAGATQVRFLYGFPFALLFAGAMVLATGEALPAMNLRAFLFCLAGAVSQIVATALMLSAMKGERFAVVTALMKTEPVLVAIFGAIVLGDALTGTKMAAIVTAVAGVIVLTTTRDTFRGAGALSIGPVVKGVASGAFFGIAAIGFRGAITGLPEAAFFVRATTILVWGLGLQTAILGAYLAVADRSAVFGSLKVWRTSLGAGFLGALASQFWFIGFALTTAANVRTLALVEVLMAMALSRKLFSETTTPRQWVGMALIVGGVAALLLAAG